MFPFSINQPFLIKKVKIARPDPNLAVCICLGDNAALDRPDDLLPAVGAVFHKKCRSCAAAVHACRTAAARSRSGVFCSAAR